MPDVARFAASGFLFYLKTLFFVKIAFLNGKKHFYFVKKTVFQNVKIMYNICRVCDDD